MPGVSWHNEKSETSKAGCAFSAILVKSLIWFQLFQLSKLKTFMMENAIDFNIILSLRFVKGFVPACCPVCTRRKKICKHLCQFVCMSVCMYVYGKCTNHRLHLHILLLLRGGKSTCTPKWGCPLLFNGHTDHTRMYRRLHTLHRYECTPWICRAGKYKYNPLRHVHNPKLYQNNQWIGKTSRPHDYWPAQWQADRRITVVLQLCLSQIGMIQGLEDIGH